MHVCVDKSNRKATKNETAHLQKYLSKMISQSINHVVKGSHSHSHSVIKGLLRVELWEPLKRPLCKRVTSFLCQRILESAVVVLTTDAHHAVGNTPTRGASWVVLCCVVLC